MVKAFLPQSFPNNIETNTNKPPQGSLEIPPVPPTVDFELHEETSGVFGNLVFDEGGGSTGQVEVVGG